MSAPLRDVHLTDLQQQGKSRCQGYSLSINHSDTMFCGRFDKGRDGWLFKTQVYCLSHPTYQPTVRVFKTIALYYRTVQAPRQAGTHLGHTRGGGRGVTLPPCKYPSFTSMLGVSLIEIASSNFDFNIISWN